MQEALKHWPTKQCISDHGSTFTSNFVDVKSSFREYLKSNGIKLTICRIRHPRSNGKVKRLFQNYDNYRESFRTKEEFMYWYNDLKLHRALNFDELETPSQSFIRKLRK